MFRRIFHIFILLSSLGVPVARADQVMWVDTGWAEIRAGKAFALTAPPGTVYHEVSSGDVFAGEFAHPDFKIDFEYGLWANKLDGLKKGYKRERAAIDGQEALIATGPGGGHFDCNDNLIAAYVKDVGAGMIAPVSLQIHGCAKDPAEIAIIRRIFGSLRFGRLKLPGQG